MDWSSNGYIPFSTHPQEEVEDEEDFYGPGQSSTNGGADAIAGAIKEEQQVGVALLASRVLLTPASFAACHWTARRLLRKLQHRRAKGAR